jgi:cell division initiation protein
MPITSLDIHQQTFRAAFRGFDPVEVDAFLQRLADEVERMTREIDRLRAELEEERRNRQTLEEALASARSLQDSMMQNARNEAEVLMNQAQLRADRILADADEELVRMRREVRLLTDRRSLWLAELSALALTLEEWVGEKRADQIVSPELAATPQEASDSEEEPAPATDEEGDGL